ncbi:hypothetical protein HAX54_005918 [Datura stramonium]|uniref:Uncharacterized protein n=1 Tax=Datura stramonium TaxID=4076 RepID=A0ABS8TC40_DATST|nr:hypothetical protein [Datura stramonium]
MSLTGKDTPCWSINGNGKFTSRSFYKEEEDEIVVMEIFLGLQEIADAAKLCRTHCKQPIQKLLIRVTQLDNTCDKLKEKSLVKSLISLPKEQ